MLRWLALAAVAGQAACLVPERRALHRPSPAGAAEAGDADEPARKKPKPSWQAGHSHYWPHVRGSVGNYSHTRHVAPSDLESSLLWYWHHKDGRFHTTVLGGPLIDDQRNIYVACEDGIRKFTTDGRLLWHYHPMPFPASYHKSPDTLFAHVPSLMGGMLFGAISDGTVYGLDLETGEEVWRKRHAASMGPDTAYVEAHDGVVVLGAEWAHHPQNDGGSKKMIGVNATDGRLMWEYQPSIPIWNAMAMFGGDGTVSFMDFTGGVHCLDAHTGVKRWHTPPPVANTFSDGGMVLGPGKALYTCSNADGEGIQNKSRGAIRAYRRLDGRKLWERVLPHPCVSWPAVSEDGATVVVPIGGFPVPEPLDPKESEVWAFDANTGKPRWHHRLPPWKGLLARGDLEGVGKRVLLQHRAACIPASWSAPTIDGRGAVLAGHESGMVYRLQHLPRDPAGRSRPSDAADSGEGTTVATLFDAKAAFLHSGMAFAEDMMAIATCDSLYVFKADGAAR